MGTQQLRTAIPTTNFRSLFSYTQGLQKPPWASFLSLFEFQGVLSLVTCAALQGFPPRATALALVEAGQVSPLNDRNNKLVWACGSS